MPKFTTGIKIIKDKRLYETSTYPTIPLSQTDIYVYTTEGDRYDSLALKYYQDSSLWYIIALANPNQKFNSIIPEAGIQLRIPNISTAISISNLNSF